MEKGPEAEIVERPDHQRTAATERAAQRRLLGENDFRLRAEPLSAAHGSASPRSVAGWRGEGGGASAGGVFRQGDFSGTQAGRRDRPQALDSLPLAVARLHVSSRHPKAGWRKSRSRRGAVVGSSHRDWHSPQRAVAVATGTQECSPPRLNLATGTRIGRKVFQVVKEQVQSGETGIGQHQPPATMLESSRGAGWQPADFSCGIRQVANSPHGFCYSGGWLYKIGVCSHSWRRAPRPS